MKTAIVGSKFREGGVAAVATLRKGSSLAIIREADNAHDPNAVAVYSSDGEHLGYVPRAMNADLARELDSGRQFVAVLTDEAIIADGGIRFAPKMTIARKVLT